MSDKAQAAARFLRRGMTPVTVCGLVLSLCGCLTIFNATFHLPFPYYYVGRQLLWVALSAAVMFAAAATPADVYRKHWAWLVGPVYVALWLVLVCGIRINGMRGWFSFHGVLLQPGELGKPAFLLGLALLLRRTQREPTRWYYGSALALGYFFAWIIPIALQPDFGMILVYAFAFVAVYWAMGGRIRELAVCAALSVPATVLVVKRNPYVASRLVSFLNPDAYADTAGWHILQFQRTLASGGPFGRSWGRGIWSQTFLPLGYSDSMFATIGEALGLVGLVPILIVILLWVYYGWCRTRNCEDEFRVGAVLGMVLMLAGQAFIHLSVNLGMMPTTGLTLPLLSYGGSSLLSTLAMIGIVEGIGGTHIQAPGIAGDSTEDDPFE